MTGPREQIPDNFDVDNLLPPSAETMVELEGLFATFDMLGRSDYSRGIDLSIEDPTTGNAVTVYCQRKTSLNADSEPVSERSLLATIGSINGRQFSKTRYIHPFSPEDTALFDGFVALLADGLDDNQGYWLRTVYEKSGRAEPQEVDELLETAPFGVSLLQNHYASVSFNNGATLITRALVGSPDFVESWPEIEPLRSAHLVNADLVRYEVSVYKDGSTKLFIKKPGERVTREVEIPESVDALAMFGDTEARRIVAHVMAERQEIARLGLDQPTEGTIKEFIAAAGEALASGLVPTKSKNN